MSDEKQFDLTDITAHNSKADAEANKGAESALEKLRRKAATEWGIEDDYNEGWTVLNP